MKKLIYSALAGLGTLLLSTVLPSCGDNTDFSNPHILTDEELANMLRQKEIADSLAKIYQVDTMFVYDVAFYVSETSYDGATVNMNMGAVAEYLGMTSQDLQKALGNMRPDYYSFPGVPDITGFAIEGDTHKDNMSAFNTNSYWGHWWDAKGCVTTWGADAVVFAEYGADMDEEGENFTNPDLGKMSIGQYPGHLQAGQKVTFVECLKYEDVRVGFTFNVTGMERGEIIAQVVSTVDQSCQVEYDNNYGTQEVEFDANKVLSDLGASSFDDVQWAAYNADGSFAQEPNAGCETYGDNSGFWFDQDGNAGAWGDKALFYICFPNEGIANTFAIGQMAGQTGAGKSATNKFAAICGDKIVKFNLKVVVKAATAIEGEVVYTKDYNVTQLFKKDWGFDTMAFDEAAVAAALGVESLDEAKIIGIDANGAYTADYSADGCGFWMHRDGYAWTGADENTPVYIKYQGGDDAGIIFVGDKPDVLDWENAYTGGSYKIGFYANGKIAMITINHKFGTANEGFTE